MAIVLSWIAAPILAQRNIELAQIFCTFDDSDRATVYTVHATDGKIGVFRIPTEVLAAAVTANKVRELLEPQFEVMEFSHGEPALSKLQPESAGPEDAEQTEAVIDEHVTPDSPADPARDAETAPVTEGQEPGLGQAVEPADEQSPE